MNNTGKWGAGLVIRAMGSILLLLVPLIIAGCTNRPMVPFIDRGRTVAVPRYMKNAVPIAIDLEQESRIVVSLPRDDVCLGKLRVTDEELVAGIKRLAQAQPEKQKIAYVQVSAAVSYGSAIELLRTMRRAGIDQVGLIVDTKGPDGSSLVGFLPVVTFEAQPKTDARRATRE